MAEWVYAKLKSNSGESLAETLVAVLVIALASVMLASMIGAATKIAKRSEDTASRFYDAANRLEQYVPGSDTIPGSALGDNSGIQPINVESGSVAFKIDLNAGLTKVENGSKPSDGTSSLQLSITVEGIKGASVDFRDNTILSYGSDK